MRDISPFHFFNNNPQKSDPFLNAVKHLTEMLDQATAEARVDTLKLRQMKYSPDQPRDDHGRWTDASGGAGSARALHGMDGSQTGVSAGNEPGGDGSPKPKPLKVSKASQYAKEHIADPNLHRFGNKQCAEKVREAVEHATGQIMKRPESYHAKDYGDSLIGVGFKPVAGMPKGDGYPPPKASYSPQEGDVIVIQMTSTSKEGHMAIYTGKDKKGDEVWVSDFIQERGPYPGEAYRVEKPSYLIYRHQNRE